MLIIKKLKSSQAFTLVELLAVMVIITIIASLFMGAGRAARQKAKKTKAESMIMSLEVAISMYRADTAVWPADDNGAGSTNLYDYLTNTAAYGAGGTSPITGWFGPYMEFDSDDIAGGQIIDPWGNAYRYDNSSPPALNNAASFDLWSAGADGTSGNADDIANW